MKRTSFVLLIVLSLTLGTRHDAGAQSAGSRAVFQAGARTEFVRTETVGIVGNGHMMMLEKNSDEIIAYLGRWMDRHSPVTASAR